MHKNNIDFWKDTLQNAGARLTRPRKAILEVVASSDQPLTAKEIFKRARKEAPNLGLVTVYRTIDALESYGLIDRFHGQDQCQTVFRSPSGHRHLLTCTSCGKSIFFDGILAEKEFDLIGRENGFEIKGHLLQLFGLCDTCREKNHA